MKVLIVAATKLEISPLLKSLKDLKTKPDVLITGVGMVATAFQLAKAFSGKKYDAAINLGVCGSFNTSFKIGEVVNITGDVFADLGAEDGDAFINLADMKLADKKDVFVKPLLRFDAIGLKGFKKVKAITVNTVHGNKKSILKAMELYHADVESMEGAAFFYACNQFKVPSLQLRAVSNYVERRNVNNWNIPLAVKNLNDAAFSGLDI